MTGEKNLTAEQAASYLHIKPHDVLRFVKQDEIPFSGSVERPLFAKDELDAWASRRILAMNGKRLGAYDREAKAAGEAEGRPFSLSSLVAPDRVLLDLDARTKASILSEIVAGADRLGLLYDPHDLLESLRQREELCSTGMPGGFAIPHPRNHDPYLASESFLLVARPIAPIHFGSPDGKPTDVFLTLVCQDDRLHLSALARLCLVLSNPTAAETLRRSQSPYEICDAIRSAESR